MYMKHDALVLGMQCDNDAVHIVLLQYLNKTKYRKTIVIGTYHSVMRQQFTSCIVSVQ